MKNFFQQQAENRRASALLVCLFCLAVALIVVIAQWFFGLIFDARIASNLNLILYRGWDVFREQNPYQWHLPSAVITFCLIAITGIYKYRQLRIGGEQIAKQLGATRVQPNTFHPLEKQLLNVVEEMAIAARTTVPSVYIQLHQSQVNAFAAGHANHNAVISVTRGALEKLTRDELQAVVAHEFSHIVNGDIKLNNRLVAATFAISFIGLLGEWILQHAATSKRGRNNSSGFELVAAIILISYGYIGTLLADFIKAAICRRREYLADANACQFNRNPEALANALKVAAGLRLPHRNAHYHQYSHLFFNQTRTPWVSSFSTHPPIIKRIQKLLPSFKAPKNGFKERTNVANYQAMQLAATRKYFSENTIPTIKPSVRANTDHLSAKLSQLVHDPYSCFTLIPMLLLSDEFELRSNQLNNLLSSQYVDAFTLDIAEAELAKLCNKQRFELIELAAPSIDCLPVKQKDELANLCWQIILMVDNKQINLPLNHQLLVWLYLEIILMQTTRAKSKLLLKSRNTKQLIQAWRYFVSLIAVIGHNDIQDQQHAFTATCQQFNMKGLTALPITQFDSQSAHQMLAALISLPVKNRNAFLQAIEFTANWDNKINEAEQTMLYSFALLLDLPSPVTD